jgi:precorrin-6B methylase 2
VELGLFAAVGQAATAAEVAGRIGADTRATERLMNALVGLGFLERNRDGVYALTESGRCLVPGQPDGVAEALGHTLRLWNTWSTLTECVRAGHAVETGWATDGFSTESFIAAMHYNSRNRAAAVVASLDLTGVSRVLDVGGGSGGYAIALCNAKRDLTATVFDRPTVTPLTRRYAEEAGVGDRVRTVDGDYNTDELGGGYDLVLLSAIVHSNSADENVALLRKCHAALVSGGQIVIQDYLMNDDRTEPVSGAMFALNMLVNTAAGDSYTETEIRGWLDATGFEETRRIDPPGSPTGLLVARKP